MKFHSLLLSPLFPLFLAAALFAGADARAGTVITGILDTYLERTAVPGQSIVRLDSSGLGVSRVVVKTTENLSPDTVATIYLEGRYDVDTGMAAYDGGLFNRMVYASVRNEHAKVTIGKQYSPHLLQLASEFDIYETSFWATPYAFFQGAGRYTLIPGAVSVEVNGNIAGKASKLSVMWADRKEETGKRPGGKQVFVSGLVQASRELRLGVSAVEDHNFSFSDPDARVLLAGFNYDAGRWRVTGGFQAIDLERSGTRINEYVIGAAYWLNPKNLVLFNHAATYEPGKAQHKTGVYGVALVHHLSQRTSLYGAIGYMDNGKAYDNYFDLKLQPGQSSNNLMAGLKHNF